MIDELKKIKNEALDEIKNTNDEKELNELRTKYLGKKGKVSLMTKQMGTLSNDEKKEFGKALNETKNEITNTLEKAIKSAKEKALNERLEKEKIDVTLPGVNISDGGMHPLMKVIEEVEDLFISMGFDVASGPEMEEDLYNFEKLNLPKNHPARDDQDSFYITAERLLRTQTSAMQARVMEGNTEKTEIRVICPGKTYRRDDDDATHSHQFTQIEGLMVGENISLAHLKGVLEVFVRRLFGEDREIRLRPNYFPFTEPSLEIDVSCFSCGGKGCNICKGTGWIEILGGGMVHPNVLRGCGYDPDKFTGFAFGIGPERVAMLKYGINDIRNFYTNDLRFLKEFNRVESGVYNESK
mgnify:FL=1